MKRFFVLAVILGLAAFGCAEKKAAAPPVQQEVQQPETQPPKAMVPEQSKTPEKIGEQQIAKVESKEIPSTTEEISGVFKDIYFEFDRYDIREDAKPVLKTVADYLRKNTSYKILVEGHCDERGTSEYNLGLGDRRAKSVKDYLISLGVPSARTETISYGKEKPVCSEPTEDCWAKNRRGHFVVMKGK